MSRCLHPIQGRRNRPAGSFMLTILPNGAGGVYVVYAQVRASDKLLTSNGRVVFKGSTRRSGLDRSSACAATGTARAHQAPLRSLSALIKQYPTRVSPSAPGESEPTAANKASKRLCSAFEPPGSEERPRRWVPHRSPSTPPNYFKATLFLVRVPPLSSHLLPARARFLQAFGAGASWSVPAR